QAEDGIRDRNVTGVQTCALPIFIYSALAQELGLIGAAGLLLLYMVFVLRGFRISLFAGDGFSKLLAAGLTFGFALQTFIIVGGKIGRASCRERGQVVELGV